jgi:hypothetical protein
MKTYFDLHTSTHYIPLDGHNVTLKILLHNSFMVLNHKYDAQIKIYQYGSFQKALCIKILPNLTFHVNKWK